METTIPQDKFNSFLRALSNLSDDFDNAIIRNGILRSRRNDNYGFCVMDFRNVAHFNIALLGIKDKINLLKCFKGSGEIKFEVNEEQDFFSFSDEETELRFRYEMDYDLLNNKFMTEEEINASIDVNQSNLVLETNISQTLSNRIKKIASNFNAENVQMFFNGNNAKLGLKKGSDQSANFSGDIETLDNITGKANIIMKSFTMDRDGDINLSMFKSQRVNNVLVIKSNMNIKDKEGNEDVNVNFYTKARVI